MISRILALIGVAVVMSACGLQPATDQGRASEANADRVPSSPPVVERPTASTPIEDLDQSRPGNDASRDAPVFSADDSAGLIRQVRRRCLDEPSGMSRQDNLKLVVAELYAAGVPPSDATEALIRGDCASLGDIVREMVEQGGDPVVEPVVDRTLFLMGPGVQGIVEAAASTGLERDLAPAGVSRTTSRPGTLDYAMAYFPVGGNVAEVQQSSSLSQLFGASEPGYAIYTYLMFGAGFDDGGAPNVETYLELLRVIETYVLASGVEDTVPRRQSHSFLIPVHADRAGDSLLDQVGPELSAHGRKAYAVYLEGTGRREVARRLLTRPGPFLVSSLEPRLIPSEASATRLIVDLSAVGAEYMYSVIDAYDRRVPAEEVGTPGSLEPIRSRLVALLPDPPVNGNNRPGTAGDWVFLLGREQVARAATVVNQPGERANGG
jgi:hypothetical protein